MSEPGNGVRPPGREPAPPRPRRFYEHAAVEEVAAGQSVPGARLYAVTLDGRPVKTPRKAALGLPNRALAEAVAAEWNGQGTHIDPATMPLTRLANSVIDGVIGREAEVRADILQYAGSDLVCYRAEGPEALVQRQLAAWDRVTAWALEALGARLAQTEGVMPVSQPALALSGIAAALEALDAWRLAGIHVMTTLTGSALLALAHAHGELDAAEAWAAAHVDEDWQIEQWGEDAEAAERRRKRREEMDAASRLIGLLNQR
ncbi:MAG: ATPase [Hyphomicrobiaceae bacterium]|nr:ATPase [Hyphomicrobiaceae bacterium]